MLIDSEAWTTNAEAARLLGVTPQRVTQMADEDGALDVLRPWPRVTLIGRRSIAEWVAGSRLPRINASTVRAWLLKRTGAAEPRNVDIDDVRDLMLEYITDARTRWSQGKRDLWALEMASRLHTDGIDVDIPITA